MGTVYKGKNLPPSRTSLPFYKGEKNTQGQECRLLEGIHSFEVSSINMNDQQSSQKYSITYVGFFHLLYCIRIVIICCENEDPDQTWMLFWLSKDYVLEAQNGLF